MQQADHSASAAPLRILPHRPVIVCYGGGVDSTAMLVLLKRQGIVPDLITFADTGAEKPETYETVAHVSAWLKTWAGQGVTVCVKKTLPTTPYNDLGGNCLSNETLPSLAFHMKSCSVKWKQDAQDYHVVGVSRGPNQQDPHPLWLDAQARGVRPVKLIGFDAGPADRKRIRKFRKTEAVRHATGKADAFRYQFPLHQVGWTRQDCIQAILEEGLPVPVKSACYFCPASQPWELWWLAGQHPGLFLKALHLEHVAMLGKHSRWGKDHDDCTYGEDWLELVRTPAKQWPSTSITVGLGISFAWNRWARENGIVDTHGNYIADPAHCLRQAEKLQGDGGNAEDLRICTYA